MLQEEWSYLDRLLKSDLKIVTDYMYPDTWKFGIAFQEGEEFSSIGIYHIRKGNNDTFVISSNTISGKYLAGILACLKKSLISKLICSFNTSLTLILSFL